MNNKRILLVGEKAVDVFVYGVCERLSPEAPVVVQKPTRIEKNDGMAGNVYSNILSLSPQEKIDFIHQNNEIYKIRHIDEASGQHLIRIDDGDDSYEPDFWTSLIQRMSLNKDGYKAIIISDYCKGLLSTSIINALTEIAKELKIPIWCDTKKILGEWSKNIDFIKINDKEYKFQLSSGVTEPWKYCKNLIVTRGKHGCDLYNQNGEIIYHVNSFSKKVWSVAGAGDSVLAALVVRFLETNNIKEAIDFSMKVAAIAVSQPGVVSVTRKEINDYI